jgi:hypothetical protein
VIRENYEKRFSKGFRAKQNLLRLSTFNDLEAKMVLNLFSFFASVGIAQHSG